MSSTSRRQLEAWLKTIEVPAGVCVVDIGGAQKLVKGRVQSWGDDILYKVLDLPQPHELADECRGEFAIKCDIQDGVDWIKNHTVPSSVDVVFCLEVSEYWTRPLDALKNIATLLKAGGVLYISFQFIYPAHNPVGEDCLRYTCAGAEKLLTLAGFGELEVVERTAENSDNLLDFYELEGMKPTKVAPHRATGWLIKAKKI